MNKQINKDLAMKKGLIISDNNEMYLKIEDLYKYLFECLLLSKVNLQTYNQQMKNSNLYFGTPHPMMNQLYNHLNEYINLDYVYLLNNFFVEKLEIKDLNLLKECYQKKDFTVTNQLLDMIKRTYHEVIKNNYHAGTYTESSYKVCYGEMIPSHFADNDAVVLKIYYSKNTIPLSEEDFLKNLEKQNIFLQNLVHNIKKEVQEALHINCNVMIEKIPN